MKTLRQLIDGKNRQLATVSPGQSVLRALEIMDDVDVGALLVLVIGKMIVARRAKAGPPAAHG